MQTESDIGEMMPSREAISRHSSAAKAVALYFDLATPHFLRDRLFDRNFAGHAVDQILAPFRHMSEYLNARGVEVHTTDYLPKKADGKLNIYVAAGMTRYRRLAGRSDVILSAYFPLECPTVEPAMYRELKNAQHLFRRIYS